MNLKRSYRGGGCEQGGRRTKVGRGAEVGEGAGRNMMMYQLVPSMAFQEIAHLLLGVIKNQILLVPMYLIEKYFHLPNIFMSLC